MCSDTSDETISVKRKRTFENLWYWGGKSLLAKKRTSNVLRMRETNSWQLVVQASSLIY